MKKETVVNIVKGLQLKEDADYIYLIFRGDIVNKWQNVALNKYSLISSSEMLKKSTIKKYFKECYTSQIGGNSDIKELFLWCKEDTNCEYKKSISIMIDRYNPRFIEI